MIRLLSASACLLAGLLATPGAAQNDPPRCPDGEADGQGISIDVSVGAHPTRVARTLDSLLVTTGDVVQDAPEAHGRWSIAPRFTWTVCPYPTLRRADVLAVAESGRRGVDRRRTQPAHGG